MSATKSVLELMESRVMMSTTLAAWDFDTILSTNPEVASTALTSPATTSGTGTAYTVGMQPSSSPNSYLYPASGAAGAGDASSLLVATGTADSGGNGGSEGGSTGYVWRVESGQDSGAPIASQGVQFNVPTTGQSNLQVQFDMNTSSTGAVAQFMVEYTTDVQDASPTWTNITSSLAFGPGDTADPNNGGHVATIGTVPTDDIYIQNNTSNVNLVPTGTQLITNGTSSYTLNGNGGAYATINGPLVGGTNTAWLNDLSVNLPAAANNSANFAFRIVNAATGTAETTVAGGAGPTYKNWRFNDISVQSVIPAAAVVTNPTNQTVGAGSPVSFTATGSGIPTPTVQWYEGGTPGTGGSQGTGTLIPSATSTTYTFTTSSGATDNGNTYYAEFSNTIGATTYYADTTAATLTDTLAAPVITVQTSPANVTARAGSNVTFTATATGSPLPTVTWQYNTANVSTGWVTATGTTTNTNPSGITENTSFTIVANSPTAGFYRCLFTNSQNPSGITSNVAQMAVGGTLVTAWNFNNASLTAGTTVLSPPPSTGTGTAVSLGMGTSGTYTMYPGTANPYTLTVTDSSGSYTTGNLHGDTSAQVQTALRALHTATTGSISVGNTIATGLAAFVILNDPGATLTGSGTGTFMLALDNSTLTSAQVTGNPDNSNLVAGDGTTSDGNTGNEWRIVGNNGWNSNAPIGTQGAQFMASTSGNSNLGAQFDFENTAQGEGNIAVEYTTDGSTWIDVPAADLSVGPDTGITVQNNPSVANGGSANTVTGGYFKTSVAGTFNNLQISLGTIAAVNNNANFGIRIVNASTGADCVNATGGALNNTSGNIRFDEVKIIANDPTPPLITTNPTNQGASIGSTATFAAAAYAYPDTATVQWDVSVYNPTTQTYAAYVPDTTDTPTTTTSGQTTNTSLAVVASSANNGDKYEAIFTNTVGTGTTSPAELLGGPVITTNPTSKTVAAGTPITLNAAASVLTGTPTPTEIWYVNGSPITSGSNGYTVNANGSLSFTAQEGETGDQYYAIFSNSNGSAQTMSATLTVTGTAIAQWIFTGGEAPTSGGNTSQGTGNSPYPTFGPISNLALTTGLLNDYTGIPTFPESDILLERSTVNSNYAEYDWRIRSGNGSGPTGSPGTPEGWSQTAPEETSAVSPITGTHYDPQGVQFNVNTAGFSNISFSFDWQQGGISDIQPQYSPDGGTTWINAPGNIIEATGTDFYGLTGSTGTPTPILVNLQSIAAANNNPNFELRLVAAYNSTLPLISDGNLLDTPSTSTTTATAASSTTSTLSVTAPATSFYFGSNQPGSYAPNEWVRLSGFTPSTYNGNFQIATVVSGSFTINSTFAAGSASVLGTVTPVHGQYATGVAGAVNAQQVFQFNSGISDGDSVPIAITGYSGSPVSFTYSSSPSTLIANMTAALTTLLGSASDFTITPSNYTDSTEITELQPVRDALGNITTDMTVTFTGSDGSKVMPTITSTNTNATISTYVNGAASGGFQPYVDGNGHWVMGNFSFNGDSTNAGGLAILANPVSTTAAAGYPISFSAEAYSEETPVTAQWYDNGNPISGATNITNAVALTGLATTASSTTISVTSTTGVGIGNLITGTNIPANAVVTAILSSTQLTISIAPTVTATGGTGNVANGPFYTSTLTLPSPSVGTGPAGETSGYNGDQITCVFSETTPSSGSATTQAATLTVVPPSAPVVVIPPSNQAVLEGFATIFTSTATAAPDATAVWQELIGGVWTALSNSSTVNILTTVGTTTTTTLTFTTNANGSDNGDQFRAFFSNPVDPYPTGVPSAAATLTVFGPETVITDWDFANHSTTAPGTFDNSPAPVPAGTDNSMDLGGVATTAGMTLAYNSADPATGTDGNGSVPADDVTNSPGALNPNFNENTWRIRGGDTAITGGTPANGWSNFVPEYSQGAAFSVPTTGYANVYVTMDWYSTTSGELDAQPQYTVDGSNWLNLGNQVQAVSNDFYGATANGGPVPLMFNVSNIPGAANNPNFGIRLVNAYDPYLSNTQVLGIASGNTSNFTLTFKGQTTGTIVYSTDPNTMAANIEGALAALSSVGGTSNVTVKANGSNTSMSITFDGLLSLNAQPAIIGDANHTIGTNFQFANALLVGTPGVPAPYNGSKGNWRFDNIVFHGDPTWLDPHSNASWNNTTETLTVTGSATIIGDPMSTLITGSPAGDGTITSVASNNLPIITGSGASAVLSISPTTAGEVNFSSLALSNGATATVTATSGTRDVLVFNQTGSTALQLSGGSTLNLTNNDAVFLGGSISSVSSQLTNGFGTTGSYWSGANGIDSSSAANDASFLTALGVAPGSAAASGTFDGVTVSGSDVLVKYTYYGDANLDGHVDGTDYNQIDNGFGSGGSQTGWWQGNFNYSAAVPGPAVDGSDYSLIDNAFNTQSVAGHASEFAVLPAVLTPVAPKPFAVANSPVSFGSDNSAVTATQASFAGTSIASDLDSLLKKSGKSIFHG
jgi:large repetitive protein